MTVFEIIGLRQLMAQFAPAVTCSYRNEFRLDWEREIIDHL